MEDRIHFIEHKGKQILLVDFSSATAQEILRLLEFVRVIVAQHGRESLLTLGDMSGAEFDHTVATRIKEVLTLDRPFVKKSAWVGTEHIPHALMENFQSFSRRQIAIFPDRDKAMDWLVED